MHSHKISTITGIFYIYLPMPRCFNTALKLPLLLSVPDFHLVELHLFLFIVQSLNIHVNSDIIPLTIF